MYLVPGSMSVVSTYVVAVPLVTSNLTKVSCLCHPPQYEVACRRVVARIPHQRHRCVRGRGRQALRGPRRCPGHVVTGMLGVAAGVAVTRETSLSPAA